MKIHSTRIGVAAVDLSTNRRVEYRSDERFIRCSTFKVLATAAIVFRQQIENSEAWSKGKSPARITSLVACIAHTMHFDPVSPQQTDNSAFVR